MFRKKNLYEKKAGCALAVPTPLVSTSNMGEIKIEKFMERLLLQSNKILGEKLSAIETHIRTEINQIKEDIQIK